MGSALYWPIFAVLALHDLLIITAELIPMNDLGGQNKSFIKFQDRVISMIKRKLSSGPQLVLR